MDPRLGVSHSHHYMHRALLIREIADAIVRELHLLQTQLSDVLALAKTCHALSEPAFDIIWAHPPLDALARRMSPRIWEAPKEPWSPRHPLRRRVTLPLRFKAGARTSIPDLGPRFWYYARRLETLNVDELLWYSGHVDEGVFVVWAALVADGAFPRLRSIYVTERYLLSFEELTSSVRHSRMVKARFSERGLTNTPNCRPAFEDLCRCASVTELSITIDITSAEYLESAQKRASLPHLQQLWLICELSGRVDYRDQFNDATLLNHVASWLSRASAIHTLKLAGPVRCADLARLPCASTLRTLHLMHCPGPGYIQEASTPVFFPQLRDLNVVVHFMHLQLTHVLLESCTGLETVCIRRSSGLRWESEPSLSVDDARALFARISAHENLRTLTLRLPMAVNPTTFWGLVPSLPRLTRLSVPLAQLSVDTVPDMHARCPSVQHFEFLSGSETIPLAQALPLRMLASASRG